MIEVAESRGRKCEGLLDDLKEKRGQWKLREDAIDCDLWRIDFETGYRSVVRQTTTGRT
jgi:hypothetical protein